MYESKIKSIKKKGFVNMWTVLWQENNVDRWDRLETEDDVKTLLDRLAKNPDVCEDDAWIFPPAADEYALTPDML